MFLLNSCLGLFSAAAFLQHPFSRSYGVNFPSSLTRVLSLVLGFSPCPPVSVLVRAAIQLTLEAFLESWHQMLRYLVTRSLPITSSHCVADLPTTLLPRLDRHYQSPAHLSLLCHSITCTRVREYQPVVHRLRLSASS